MKRKTTIWTLAIFVIGLAIVYVIRPIYLINKAENILDKDDALVATSRPDSSFYIAMDLLYGATKLSFFGDKARNLMDTYTSRYMAEYIAEHQRLKNEYYAKRYEEIQSAYNEQINSSSYSYELTSVADSVREVKLDEIRKYLDPKTTLDDESKELFCGEWLRFETYLRSLNSQGAELNILENCGE